MASMVDQLLGQVFDQGKKRVQEFIDNAQNAAVQRDIATRALERIAHTRGCDCWRTAQDALDNIEHASKK